MLVLQIPFWGRHRCRSDLREAVSSGFTLIELMIAVAVLGVLVAVGIPSFSKLIAENRMAGVTNEFTASLQLARSEAVRRGGTVSVRSVSGAETFQTGWNVFAETASSGSTGTYDTGDTYVQQASTVGGKTVISRTDSSWAVDTSSSARMYIAFNSRGALASGAAAYFRLCDSGNTSIKGRGVSVSVTGRVTLESTTLTCS
jgi:type IV fimbrial biogenesis protein FimT